MNCPKCQTPAAAGAAHCKRCGTPLGAKAAATPSSSDEIDLMPLEPTKPSYSAYEPPPGMEVPPPPAGKAETKSRTKGAPDGPPAPPGADYVPKIRGSMAAPPKSKLTLIIGGGVGVIVVGLILWMVLRTKNEMVLGKPKFEQAVSLNAGQVRVENVEVTGVMNYVLEVNVSDGDMIVGVVQRSPKDSAKLPDLKKLEPLETVKKGETKELKGEFKGKEKWSWVLLNDTKKPARAKVKFVATPP
jgi:hypothetical protein